MYTVVQCTVNSTGGYKAGEYPCGPIVANYLWVCNGNVSVSLLCGLFCTCGMQKIGNNIGIMVELENNHRLIFGMEIYSYHTNNNVHVYMGSSALNVYTQT